MPPWRSARVERASGKVRIAIGPKRAWAAWILFGGAVAVWAATGISAYERVLNSPNANGRAWLLFWFLGWTLWGGWGLARVFVVGLGREVIEVGGRSIALRREVMGIGFSRTFDLGRVRNLHLAAPPPAGTPQPLSRGWPALPPPVLAGSIRFEYLRRTHEFGVGLGWPEMEQVLAGLREQVAVASGSSASA